MSPFTKRHQCFVETPDSSASKSNLPSQVVDAPTVYPCRQTILVATKYMLSPGQDSKEAKRAISLCSVFATFACRIRR